MKEQLQNYLISKWNFFDWVKTLSFLILSIFVSGSVYGQSFQVSGTVTDSNSGETLPGVNVSVKGTTTGAYTNADGFYQLQAPSENDTLIFSFVGYDKQTIPINGQATINVALSPAVITGSEMVVVGYGSQQESSLTGSISSVSSEELNEVSVGSVQQALQGRVAGMTVRNNGGPGEEPIIEIRGISSINYASDPLYVVDGLPTNISNVNSNDIASVEVLKDASAAAIYGSRATNGVVIITTKKGARNTGLSVSYDSYVGVESPWKTIDLLNTQQYMQYAEAITGSVGNSLPPRLQDDNFNEPIYDGASKTYDQTNTDWQDAYFRDGMITDHQVSMSGGNDISRFYLSGGYFKQEGTVVGLNNQRGNFTLNSDHRVSDMISFGESFTLSHSRQRYDDTQGNRTRLVQVVRSLPYLPVRDPTTDGGFREAANSFDGSDPQSPVKNALLLGQSFDKTTELQGTAYLDIDFAQWLNFRSTFGVNYSNGFLDAFDPIYDSKGNTNNVATIENERNVNTTLLFSQQLTYDQTFLDKHHFNVVGVYEQEERDNFNEISSGNQSTNTLRTLAGATNVAHETIESESRLISFVGRLSYDYDNKYLINVAMRRDGLSIWPPGNKWANFPSGSVGWRIDQESFLQDQDLISELKIRGGYGITGLNGQLIGDNYPWQVALQANGATYPFNNENSVGNASYFRALGNTELEWEKTEQWNVGLDVGLLSNRITLTADYYQRYTDNLLLEVPIPTSFGLNEGSQGGGAGVGVLSNVGEMENNGLDIQLGYNKSSGNFTWDVTGLVSIVRNEVLSLDTPTAAIGAGGDADFGGGEDITQTEAGHPIQSFYGYVTDGIFQDWDDVYDHATQNQDPDGGRGAAIAEEHTAPGDIRFKDLNNDGEITPADRTYTGSYLPDFSYSLNFNAYYRNFDLSLFLQGVQGNDIFNAARVIREGQLRLFGAGTSVLDAWTPDNTNTTVPRTIAEDPNGNVRPSNRWLEDGSYLRLKNVELGYTVPASALNSFTNGTINNLRIYVAAQNILTFTGYKGWDPEIGSKNTTLTNGIDYGQYPAARSFRIGLKVDLQ